MTVNTKDKNRSNILDAAKELLQSIGRDAITIRAVADAANVQAPTIYRLFEDKRGLLNAVAEHGFLEYMGSDQNYVRQPNLIDELRNGWDFHIKFGAENVELYALMYDHSHYPHLSPAAEIAHKGFNGLIVELAQAGYLKVSQDQAMFVIFASAAGTVRSNLAFTNMEDRQKYCEFVRESMISAITNQSPDVVENPVAQAAATLSVNVSSLNTLSSAEKSLLTEWLSRIS